MIKRRDFLKKSGMIAMAAAFPGIVNAEVKAADEGAVLNKNKIKVNNQRAKKNSSSRRLTCFNHEDKTGIIK